MVVTLCPISPAIRYPSPVEPVRGYEAPPVVRITASASYDFFFVTTPFALPSMTTI